MVVRRGAHLAAGRSPSGARAVERGGAKWRGRDLGQHNTSLFFFHIFALLTLWNDAIYTTIRA